MNGTLQSIDSALHSFDILGETLTIYDHLGSEAAEYVAAELNGDCYGVRDLPVEDGSVIVDVGAHVGMFSIWMAKRFLDARIIAYEGYPPNYDLLVKNIRENGIGNITACSVAVTGDGRKIEITTDTRSSCRASMFGKRDGQDFWVPSITLPQIFERHQIAACLLLKIDCEGSEYEILQHPRLAWSKIENLSGEFHTSGQLRCLGYDPQTLLDYCSERTKVLGVHFEVMDPDVGIEPTLTGFADPPLSPVREIRD